MPELHSQDHPCAEPLTASDLSAPTPVLDELDAADDRGASRAQGDARIDWAAALDEHQTWLRTVIAARVGEAAAVEEVFQEVSLAAVRQKSPINDPTKIAPWLYRLAVIHSLLYRRKMGRKRKLLERYQEKVPIPDHDTRQVEPLEWLLAEERKKTLAAAMKKLPNPLQELLMLKYVHDWSYKEMADKLGTSVSAVQARLHRARASLREKLAGKMES